MQQELDPNDPVTLGKIAGLLYFRMMTGLIQAGIKIREIDDLAGLSLSVSIVRLVSVKENKWVETGREKICVGQAAATLLVTHFGEFTIPELVISPEINALQPRQKIAC
jgi:hypothetical protein